MATYVVPNPNIVKIRKGLGAHSSAVTRCREGHCNVMDVSVQFLAQALRSDGPTVGLIW